VGLVLLAGLMGLTSWAVASLATWLVPLYVIGMVLIFVSPRSQKSLETEHGYPDSRLEASNVSASLFVSPAGSGLSAMSPSLVVDNSTGTQVADSIPVGSTSARTRRNSARTRKQVNSGILAIADPSPVAWIRVGPGKFVRSDSHPQDFSGKDKADTSSEVHNPTWRENSQENQLHPCDSTDDPMVVEYPTMVELTRLQIGLEQTMHNKEPRAIPDLQPASDVMSEILDLDMTQDTTNSCLGPSMVGLDQELSEEENLPTTSTTLFTDNLTDMNCELGRIEKVLSITSTNEMPIGTKQEPGTDWVMEAIKSPRSKSWLGEDE
jgi:hypothetical protein